MSPETGNDLDVCMYTNTVFSVVLRSILEPGTPIRVLISLLHDMCVSQGSSLGVHAVTRKPCVGTLIMRGPQA
jgi:hypothetical protein